MRYLSDDEKAGQNLAAMHTSLYVAMTASLSCGSQFCESCGRPLVVFVDEQDLSFKAGQGDSEFDRQGSVAVTTLDISNCEIHTMRFAISVLKNRYKTEIEAMYDS